MEPTGGDTVRRILLMVAVLLPAGCSSLDSIPLSDVPIPEAAPRIAAEVPAPMPPPSRPQPDKSSSVPSAPAPVEATASLAAPPLYESAAVERATESGSTTVAAPAGSGVKNAGEAIVSAVDTLLSPMPVMAFAEEASGSALAGDGALYRSGLVERREVGRSAGTIEPEAKPQPVEVTTPALDPTPVSFGEVTLSQFEIPSFDARTWIWVTIGFAALLGLFLSARQANN